MICKICDSSCLNCENANSNSCTSCDSDKFLNPDKNCKSDCPSNYFKNALTNICETCSPTCKTCYGSAVN